MVLELQSTWGHKQNQGEGREGLSTLRSLSSKSPSLKPPRWLLLPWKKDSGRARQGSLI